MRSTHFERMCNGTGNYADACRARTFIRVVVGLEGAWLLASGPMILPMKHAYMNKLTRSFLAVCYWPQSHGRRSDLEQS